ncbi:hypothetical protein ABZ646_04060 [Streptomyces sp. NPDC007162]|uniref:hypothetical protein n=1 Tax=Streptomyces sp. NPDC007162 TaxID=3156917 RepID=UPI0033C317E4
MRELAEPAERVALIDARPVDRTDPDWVRKMNEDPHPMDEVGIRPEAEAALRDAPCGCFPSASEPSRDHRRLLDVVEATALSPEKSRDLIHAIIQNM